MRFLILYILIYFHDGLYANLDVPKGPSGANSFKNFEIFAAPTKYNSCDYCKLPCFNRAESAVVVQTAFNNLTRVNVPFENDIIAHVYYNCEQGQVTGDVSKYRFHKICGDIFEHCVNSFCKYNSYWNSTKHVKDPVLNVNLILPTNVESIKMKISKCDSQQIIFNFKIRNKAIDYIRDSRDYNFTDSIFVANNLRKMPIVLEIQHFVSRELKNIAFNVTRKTPFVICPNAKYEYEYLAKEKESEFELLNKFKSDSINKTLNFKEGISMVADSLLSGLRLLRILKRLNKKSLKANKLSSNDSYRVLNNMEFIFQNTFRHLSNKKKSMTENNNSYYTYATYINKTRGRHSIPFPDNVTGDKEVKQFVEFEIGNMRGTARNQELIATFIQYKDIDSEDEEAEAERKTNPLLLKNETMSSPTSNSTPKPYIFMFKNSDIVSLSLNENINVKVQFKLKTKPKFPLKNWRYTLDNECGYLVPGSGWDWSTEGCTIQKSKENGEFCECNHLSNFAMLLSLKETNQDHIIVFRYLSIFGGVINGISFILFLTFVLLINSRDKLRLDQLNIAICLLCGCTLFLFGGVTSLNPILCKISAIFTHFLLLAAFVWKLILGINVVRMITLSKFQNVDWMVKYRMVILGIGYAIPIIIVSISGSLYWNVYMDVGENTCWIADQRLVLLVFLLPVGIILAINLIVLFFIANTLIRNYINTRKTKVNASNELLVFLQLMVSMGLTWVPLCFSIKYLIAMYIWMIFYPLQGLMMFLFVVVINRENREKVSAYIIQRYSSLRSKSTSSTDTKNTLKSRSVHSKNTEPTQSLLSDHDKDQQACKVQNGLPTKKLIDLDDSEFVPESVC